jgi:hypothetical protein
MKHRQVVKIKKKYPILLQLLFVVVPLTQSMLYATGGTMAGSGTITEPFLVADYADLKVVGKSATFPGSAVYRLVADIDASASQTENSGAGFVPINDSSIHYFTGTFLGAGHIIKNLHINRSGTDYIGLFGNVWGGMIDSLGLLNANITADSGYVGSVASYNNTGTITNCYATGSVIDFSQCLQDFVIGNLRHFVQNIAHLMHPTTLSSSSGKAVPQGFPQTRDSIGNHHSNPLKSSSLQVTKHFTP